MILRMIDMQTVVWNEDSHRTGTPVDSQPEPLQHRLPLLLLTGGYSDQRSCQQNLLCGCELTEIYAEMYVPWVAQEHGDSGWDAGSPGRGGQFAADNYARRRHRCLMAYDACGCSRASCSRSA